MSYVENLTSVLQSANPSQVLGGANWYPHARTVLSGIAGEYERHYLTVAALTAVTSPQASWLTNIASVRHILAYGTKPSAINGDTWRKIERVLSMSPESISDSDLSKQLKVRRFFACLCGIESLPCVDTHIINAANNRLTSETERKAIFANSRRSYDAISDALVTVANAHGITPAVAQATIWVAWRDSIGSERRAPGSNAPLA